jgi:hypothetical protein
MKAREINTIQMTAKETKPAQMKAKQPAQPRPTESKKPSQPKRKERRSTQPK